MRPEVTFLTSGELQSVIRNELSDDEMDELRRFRDRVMDRFRDNLAVLEVMEDLYGEEWPTLDIDIWVFDGQHESISSPILLQREDEDAALFTAYQMLAKQLIRGRPPESDLVASGYDKLDAVSALLAKASLESALPSERHRDLIETAESESEDIKMWRTTHELAEQWDAESTTLYDWLDGR